GHAPGLEPAVSAHVVGGVVPKQPPAGCEDIGQKILVVLGVFQFPTHRPADPGGRRGPTQQPEPQPLIVEVVRYAEVWRRSNQELCRRAVLALKSREAPPAVS